MILEDNSAQVCVLPVRGRPVVARDDSLRLLDVQENMQGVTIVRFTGQESVRRENTDRLEEELLQLADCPRRILLDLSNAQYLPSSVIGTLILLNKCVHGQQGTLRLCCHPHFREVLRVTRLDQLLDAYCDEQTALDGL